MPNPKSKSKKWKRIIILLVVMLVGSGVGYKYFKKKELPVTIQKEKATQRSLTELVEANGKVQPVFQVKISPEVSGEIIELPVKEGQFVKKGDLLVKIKPDNYVASRDQQKASYQFSLTSLNSSMANLEKAELEFKRSDELHKSQLVADSQFQEAKTSYDVAKASLAGAKQQVELSKAALLRSEDDLSKTTIYSPLTGTITKLNSQLGERVVGTAMMAGTEIMTVSDLNEMEARVDIGEIDVVLIKLGQCARLEVDSFKDNKFTGVVTDIANSAKATTTSGQESTKFEVRIRIKEKESSFRPGMSCTAKIETRYRTNVLTVPIQSVTTRVLKPKTNEVASATNKVSGSSNTAAKSTGTNAATEPASVAAATNAVTNQVASGSTNDVKKKSDADKAVEVVFVVDNDHVKARPVKRGISDDAYVEITEGLKENEEVVIGGYKAIARELEDGKAVVVGTVKPDAEAKK